MRKALHWSAAGLLIALAIGAAAAFQAATLLSEPAPSQVGDPPRDLPVELVSFDSGSGSRLSGWFIPGKKDHAAVLLLHGIGANRLQMLDRARFLHEEGYAVLLFDFQAEGESPGERLTFGYLEAKDARSAFNILREKAPGERIGVIGFSLGGVAAVLAEKPLEADAMVLEAIYAEFETAVENRMAHIFGGLGRYFTPFLTLQVKPRLGFAPSDLQPARRMAQIHVPILLIAGSDDRSATLEETRRIYANANEPKELWIIPGAGHADFHGIAPIDYQRRVLRFLQRTLRR